MLGWSYLELGGNSTLASFAMDYDGGKHKPTKAHNVFATLTLEAGNAETAFAIVHMSGALQSVLSRTAAVQPFRGSPQAATVVSLALLNLWLFTCVRTHGCLLRFLALRTCPTTRSTLSCMATMELFSRASAASLASW